MSTVIRVENLSKKYAIGAKEAKRDNLREVIIDTFAAPFRRLRSGGGTEGDDQDFWALKDVSFDVQEGEVVGIIGRNGAGKSTLLKILSKITEPTSGSVKIKGRVASLLEVGTGFHPELTGRENIYLNGAILGMTRKEINSKFDEIVIFSEIEKFLDTPVKRYSSGMYVRLAFAVAAHLDPEILIIDEVLSVGDAEFQRKCLGKMKDVASGGRTVLFVSHQLSAIQRLCHRGIVMQKGYRMSDGPTAAAVDYYLSSYSQTESTGGWTSLTDVSRQGSGEVKFLAYQCIPVGGSEESYLYPDEPIEINLLLNSEISRSVGSLAVTFYDRAGTKLVNADTISLGKNLFLHQGENLIKLRIDRLHLNPGLFHIGFWLANPPHVFDFIEIGGTVEVIDKEILGLGHKPVGDGFVTCSFSIVD